MRDSTTFGIGIALLVGLAGCSGGGDSSAPPSTTLAAEAAAKPQGRKHPPARIVVMKKDGECGLRRVNPDRYPNFNASGDTVSWEMHYLNDCPPYDQVILTSFHRVEDEGCVLEAPFADCGGSIGVPAEGVECIMDTGFTTKDWEYSVCAYNDDELVSFIDPRLQTRPGEPIVPPGPSPTPDPDATPVPKVCKKTMNCPTSYE